MKIKINELNIFSFPEIINSITNESRHVIIVPMFLMKQFICFCSMKKFRNVCV